VSNDAADPALGFLVVVGLALVALLFVANTTLEPGSPSKVTSQRAAASAPAPNMTSQAVLAAQPKSAWAEAPPKNNRPKRPIGYQPVPQTHVRFGSKADICGATSHVRFTPDSDRESVFPQ
jgi:hypothetical protein